MGWEILRDFFVSMKGQRLYSQREFNTKKVLDQFFNLSFFENKCQVRHLNDPESLYRNFQTSQSFCTYFGPSFRPTLQDKVDSVNLALTL